MLNVSEQVVTASGSGILKSLTSSQKSRLQKTLNRAKLRANPDMNLTSLPAMAQLRTTRCLTGDAVFCAQNALRAEDSIGATGDFRETGLRYEIPVGTLYHSEYPNLLATGRTISATTAGWEVSRVIPTAAMTGQAAGTLAALAVKQGLSVNRVPVAALQTRLTKAGVTLHF